jgi:hypothetical protein
MRYGGAAWMFAAPLSPLQYLPQHIAIVADASGASTPLFFAGRFKPRARHDRSGTASHDASSSEA